MTPCHAEFFDECEDVSVFGPIAEADLPHASSKCTLKVSYSTGML